MTTELMHEPPPGYRQGSRVPASSQHFTGRTSWLDAGFRPRSVPIAVGRSARFRGSAADVGLDLPAYLVDPNRSKKGLGQVGD
jgi:hypothetical protein